MPPRAGARDHPLTRPGRAEKQVHRGGTRRRAQSANRQHAPHITITTSRRALTSRARPRARAEPGKSARAHALQHGRVPFAAGNQRPPAPQPAAPHPRRRVVQRSEGGLCRPAAARAALAPLAPSPLAHASDAGRREPIGQPRGSGTSSAFAAALSLLVSSPTSGWPCPKQTASTSMSANLRNEFRAAGRSLSKGPRTT